MPIAPPPWPAIIRFPRQFPAEAMLAEAQAFPQSAWIGHFNQEYHDGGWRGIALRAPGGAPGFLHYGQAQDPPYQDTLNLDRCPVITQVLAGFHTPLKAVRLLSLAPGSHIREHCDDGLGYADGEVRLHIPLSTNPQVEFYLESRRVLMAPGELWYMDFSRPHRLNNLGESERIHLVIDCVVTPWVDLLMAEGARCPLPDTDHLPTTAQQWFDAFRTKVFSDPGLQQALLNTGVEDFPAQVTHIGHAAGFPFSEEEVRAAVGAGRRAWNKLWIL